MINEYTLTIKREFKMLRDGKALKEMGEMKKYQSHTHKKKKLKENYSFKMYLIMHKSKS